MWEYWIIIIPIFLISSEDSGLISVVVLYRHGDRAPMRVYPKDPNAKIISQVWPDGFGELTSIGKRQLFALGQFFRRKYNGFLSETYSHKDIKVISSDRDRCLMSAAANLAGLYPPKGHQLWNSDLRWLPIPIHEMPKALLGLAYACPEGKKLQNEAANQYFHDAYKKHRKLFDFLSENSGLEATTLRKIKSLHNILSVEKMNNLTLPDWSEAVIPEKTLPFVELYHSSFTYTPEISRLTSGPLLYLITSHFENITENSGRNSKISHGVMPPYAATLIFELRTRGDNKFVNILYKKETDSDALIRLNLGKLGFDCEWSEFKSVVEPLKIDMETYENECLKLGTGSSGYSCFYGYILHFHSESSSVIMMVYACQFFVFR
ncbi:hypothetical protein JTB14_025276 [Gonioctena quinquepunctata]|nr:hypothetical protein JTB14_025276 [Gonioctena quinquepunctata]